MPWDLTGNAGTNAANNFLGTTDNQPLVIKTNGGEVLRIDTHHNVGIGTTTPSAPLHISGPGDQFLDVSSTDAPQSYTRLMAVTSNGVTESQLQFRGRLLFVAPLAGQPRLSIQETGNVGIGADLDVQGNVSIGTPLPNARLTVAALGPTQGGPFDAAGVVGYVTNALPAQGRFTAGVRGINDGGHGVQGQSDSHIGVEGTSNSATALFAESQSGIGVWGVTHSGPWAGHFEGAVQVLGNLSKSGGGFKIDDPRAPAHRYLNHSFVESAEMKNIYDGLAVLDAQGEATVELPGWFEAVNEQCRYQLTAIGAPGPHLHIADEMDRNCFRIAGGTSGMKVAWQVTGVRKDAWARAHAMAVEEEKTDSERGYYLHPELYGAPEEQGLMWGRYPEVMRAKHKGVNQPNAPKVS
jgi:hypothetical protein